MKQRDLPLALVGLAFVAVAFFLRGATSGGKPSTLFEPVPICGIWVGDGCPDAVAWEQVSESEALDLISKVSWVRQATISLPGDSRVASELCQLGMLPPAVHVRGEGRGRDFLVEHCYEVTS